MQASKFYFACKILILIVNTLAPLVLLWLWKSIFNGITGFDDFTGSLLWMLAAYLLTSFLLDAVSCFDQYVNSRYADEMTCYVEDIMMGKISRMDLRFYDEAAISDKIRHTRANFDILQSVSVQIFNIVTNGINVILTFAVLSVHHAWIALFTLLLLIPYFIYNQWFNKMRLEKDKEQIRDRRKMDYFSEAFYDHNMQFEIKLNRTGLFFISRYKELWNRLFHINKQIDQRHNIKRALFFILNSAAEIFVLLVSIVQCVGGKIGIGDLQFNFDMVFRLRDQATMFLLNINGFLTNSIRLTELQEFINLEPIIEKSGALTPSASPEIEFCHVSFRYPNTAHNILENCSFSTQRGEKVSLIGLNGSGKSTIIKLLLRFYDVTDGMIKIDGRDIKEYNVYQLRNTFGILFQDYVMYCLPLREIIALPDFDQRFNDDKLREACDISGFTAVMDQLDMNFDTVLGRYYTDDGKDLSGGQWQLLSLARAYFKQNEFMILDEPSASLDPISEDRIFSDLYRLRKDKSAISISHRLSNAVDADRILILSQGCVTEEGSHTELLKQDGEYARLFKLQASKYI